MVNALIFPLDLVTSDQPQEILAFHGWGFDASWWHPWHTWLTAQGHTVACYDRGYFGHPQAVAFGASSSTIAAPTIVTPQNHSPSHRLKKTLWCHSLGTYFCPVELFAQADRLVLWASFLHFHPQDPQAQRLSGRKLDRMVARFHTDPIAVWQDFIHRTFDPDPIPHRSITQPPISTWNLAQLSADLNALHHLTLNPQVLAQVPEILIYRAEQDAIVVKASQDTLRADLQAANPEAAIQEYVWPGGHGFPFTQSPGSYP